MGELRQLSGCPACPHSSCRWPGHAAAKGSGTRANCWAKAVEEKLVTTAWSRVAHLGHRTTQGRRWTRKGAGPCWQRGSTDWSTLSFADIKPRHAGTLRGEEQLRKWHCRLVSARPRCAEIGSSNRSSAKAAAISLKATPRLGMHASISQVPSLPVHQEGKERRSSGKTEEPSCLPGKMGKAKPHLQTVPKAEGQCSHQQT